MEPLNVLYEMGEPRWSELFNTTQFVSIVPLLNTLRGEIISLRSYFTFWNFLMLAYLGIAFFILESVNHNRHALDSLQEDAAYNRESIEEMYRLMNTSEEDSQDSLDTEENPDCGEDCTCALHAPSAIPDGHMRVTLETENDYEQFIVCGRTGHVVERVTDENSESYENEEQDHSCEEENNDNLENEQDENEDERVENDENQENESPVSIPPIPCRCGNEHYYEFYDNGTYYCSVECMDPELYEAVMTKND